jgi:hypothetical protein
MVTMLAARWQLGHELYRETCDVDLGIAPIAARDHHVVGRLKDLDYTQVAGNRFAWGLSVASDSRCKSAGVVPSFMIRLGDGTDSFGTIRGRGGGDRTWPQLAGWFEQRAAQVLEQPQAV